MKKLKRPYLKKQPRCNLSTAGGGGRRVIVKNSRFYLKNVKVKRIGNMVQVVELML
jgi:hypothetical protein